MTDNKKKRIAKSLISGLTSMRPISKEASSFIIDWCMTGNTGKTQDMYDIWEIVLRNHIPNDTHILFRGCEHYNSGKIESYTTSISCAKKFRRNEPNDLDKSEAYLLIMDTRHLGSRNANLPIGQYQHSYYPIFQLLRKEKIKLNSHFSERFIDNYECEEECIAWTYGSLITACRIVDL
jgi:hypothetical protein